MINITLLVAFLCRCQIILSKFCHQNVTNFNAKFVYYINMHIKNKNISNLEAMKQLGTVSYGSKVWLVSDVNLTPKHWLATKFKWKSMYYGDNNAFYTNGIGAMLYPNCLLH